MTRPIKATCPILISLVLVNSASAQASPQAPPDGTADVVARVESYVAAFNRRDAAACAKQWSENAEYLLPESGQRIQGRTAIREALQKLLATDERFRLSLNDQRFRQVSRDVVMEEGTAILLSATHGHERAQYLVVHVKHGNHWYRDSVRESTLASANASQTQLADLEWLVGHWQAQDDQGSVDVHGKWTHGKRFISRSFQVRGVDGFQLNGTQIVGWDPSAGVLRSWSFDSEGGFEQGVWSRDGERWLLKVNAVMPDGTVGSEQRLVARDGDRRMSTEIVQQQVNGQLLPGGRKVMLVRQHAE